MLSLCKRKKNMYPPPPRPSNGYKRAELLFKGYYRDGKYNKNEIKTEDVVVPQLVQDEDVVIEEIPPVDYDKANVSFHDKGIYVVRQTHRLFFIHSSIYFRRNRGIY